MAPIATAHHAPYLILPASAGGQQLLDVKDGVDQLRTGKSHAHGGVNDGQESRC